MKKLSFACICSIICSTLPLCAQPAFQNLDFESAHVPDLPPDQYEFVPFSDALPGWTGYFGATPATTALHNTFTLGLYNVSILGPDFTFPTPDIQILDGQYSAMIQAGENPPSPPVPTAIAQTGLVPLGSHSIQMSVWGDIPGEINGLSVTLGGQFINLLVVTESLHNYTVYGDVSSFAGQVLELRITASPLPTDSNTTFELDDISFSPAYVPEPRIATLLVMGALLIFRRDFRRQLPNRALAFSIGRQPPKRVVQHM